MGGWLSPEKPPFPNLYLGAALQGLKHQAVSTSSLQCRFTFFGGPQIASILKKCPEQLLVALRSRKKREHLASGCAAPSRGGACPSTSPGA